MRVFTIVGVVLTVFGLGLLVVACTEQAGGTGAAIGGMAAGIAATTLLPLGIVFTIIGVWMQRLVGGRRRLLETGMPGQASILSVAGGNVVVNNTNALLTFRLRVTLPGRPPYEVDHRQLMSLFSMAAIQVGSTVPVMVDPGNPDRLTIDLAGAASTAAARQARPVRDDDGARPEVVPNRLSTMGGIRPNTIATGTGHDVPSSGSTLDATSSVALDAATASAITDQLSRLGITVDPALLAGGHVTMDATTLDLRPEALGSLLDDGIVGTAFIRSMTDTGVNVRGDSLVRLTLDVHGPDGTSYRVDTGSLVPDVARSRALPGATVPVRIDPAEPTNVVVDWSALG